ncbi:MAG: hypothetical protein WCG25_00270 [bacterium]
MKYYDTNSQSWIDSSPMIYTQTAPLTAAKALAVCKQKYPNTTKTTYRDISMIQ